MKLRKEQETMAKKRIKEVEASCVALLPSFHSCCQILRSFAAAQRRVGKQQSKRLRVSSFLFFFFSASIAGMHRASLATNGESAWACQRERGKEREREKLVGNLLGDFALSLSGPPNTSPGAAKSKLTGASSLQLTLKTACPARSEPVIHSKLC